MLPSSLLRINAILLEGKSGQNLWQRSLTGQRHCRRVQSHQRVRQQLARSLRSIIQFHFLKRCFGSRVLRGVVRYLEVLIGSSFKVVLSGFQEGSFRYQEIFGMISIYYRKFFKSISAFSHFVRMFR